MDYHDTVPAGQDTQEDRNIGMGRRVIEHSILSAAEHWPHRFAQDVARLLGESDFKVSGNRERYRALAAKTSDELERAARTEDVDRAKKDFRGEEAPEPDRAMFTDLVRALATGDEQEIERVGDEWTKKLADQEKERPVPYSVAWTKQLPGGSRRP